ncbi:MAG: hypothetical protein A2233_04320 [Candidatus Kerfeldbacteria bacterium RIFOXYA2_FULL_38_24]|uniref:2,4-dihydroxyhept-2-ene-1,7-dioic acid aldolase n=1 Tax=Candidatus Kerfeldbacteria bacterium RIFOXYB2_FULL_38_14 TaxID=1798547 RepID=A0A1G2BCJ2_9BACT|nr:MAG: hypothetical protein A2233_04320 [Candidatus Kerfeldbacteria bacterium RIFOXYA2_FULL_38_24]OGY86943.1 MAG: hypothetical protein A2319_00165 [Candidatus Kerfeldbacteria bacterium RIFOXYB2_FULL_38_14]
MILDIKTIFQKFSTWNRLKFKIHISCEKNIVYFKEREIWWCALGKNIGYEQNGKNEKFERPVLILKKFNKNLLWALPLTSKQKNNRFYYKIDYAERSYVIILSQIRTISSKRLLRKIRTLSKNDFINIQTYVKSFL